MMTNQEDHTMINRLKNLLPHIDEENLREFFEERAGIREYCGGMNRDTAEEKAFGDTVEYFCIPNNVLGTTKNI